MSHASDWYTGPYNKSANFQYIKLDAKTGQPVKVHGKITCKLDMKRFAENFEAAQYYLDSQVMTDMIPYMPMVTGDFIDRTKAISASLAGSGWVCAAADPFGRFLYRGKTMVSPTTGSPFARAGERKVLVSQDRGLTTAKENLLYNRQAHPHVHAYWFELAKRDHGEQWVKAVKIAAGGGNVVGQ